MITVEEMLTPVEVEVFLTTGESKTVTTDARWASKMRNAIVHPFERGGEFILFIIEDSDGNNPNPDNDKGGMSVPHYLTGTMSQYHYRDNNPYHCTTSNFGSRHEKHTNRKHN